MGDFLGVTDTLFIGDFFGVVPIKFS